MGKLMMMMRLIHLLATLVVQVASWNMPAQYPGYGTNGVAATRCCANTARCDYTTGQTNLDKHHCCPTGGEITILKDLQGDVFPCDCGGPQTDCRDDWTTQNNEATADATSEPQGHVSNIPIGHTQYNTRANW